MESAYFEVIIGPMFSGKHQNYLPSIKKKNIAIKV